MAKRIKWTTTTYKNTEDSWKHNKKPKKPDTHRVHTVWFYLYTIKNKANPCSKSSDSVWP